MGARNPHLILGGSGLHSLRVGLAVLALLILSRGTEVAAAEIPVDLEGWHEEIRQQLADQAQMRSIEILSDATTLIFRLTYYNNDLFGRPMQAIFKPIQRKWRQKKQGRSTANPLAPELAAYALVRQSHSWPDGRPEFLFPPTIEILLPKEKILELANASLEDSESELRALVGAESGERKIALKRVRKIRAQLVRIEAALEGGITRGPCVLYDGRQDCARDSRGHEQVRGLLALWLPGEREKTDVYLASSRKGMSRLARNLSRLWERQPSVAHAMAQLFVLDYLIANNDRPGNVFYSSAVGRVVPIDHDDSFVCPFAKVFNVKLVQAMEAYSARWTDQMLSWIAERSDDELREQIFYSFDTELARRYARGLRKRAGHLRDHLRDDVPALPEGDTSGVKQVRTEGK